MSPEEIRMIIKEIPTLIMYVVPGYLTLWGMGLALSRKISKDNHLLMKSIAISYIFIVIGNWMLNGEVLKSWGTKTSLIIISLVIGYIVGRIMLSACFTKVLRKIGITKTMHDNFLTDIIDFDYGLDCMAYLPDERMIYKGEIRKFEEKVNAENSYIVLANYKQFNYDGDVIIESQVPDNYRVLLNTRDISRIELFYDSRSLKIK